MESKKKPPPPKKPRGKEEVVDAIERAAAELFAERGPVATSSREIAERAGVNYGLIHRHFGGRERLEKAALNRMAAEFRDAFSKALTEGVPPFTAVREHPGYPRALASLALEGRDLAEVQTDAPLIDTVLALIASTREDGKVTLDDRVAVAMFTLSTLGWAVFGDFVRQALDLDDVDETEVAERIHAVVLRMLSG